MKNDSESFPLNEIKDISLAESEDTVGNPVYRIELKLKLKTKINASLTELWINNKEGLQNTIDTIKEFLKN